MPVRIYTTNAGADLSDAEAALLAELVARHGRAVLLAPTFAELDLCRHDAAEVGVSLGIDYKTPSSWLRSLWELMGDGARFRRQPAAPDAVLGHGHASRRCRPAAAFAQPGHGAYACAHGPRCAAGCGGDGCRTMPWRQLPAGAKKRCRGSCVRAFACLRGWFGPSKYGRALRGS